MRRRHFAASATGLTIGLAGCAATQTEFEAAPGRFSTTAADAAGYRLVTETEAVTRRTVDLGGSQREITIRNQVAEYERDVVVAGSERPLAGATVVTTPSIAVAGREFNPVADASLDSLADRAAERVGDQLAGDGLDGLSSVGEEQATVLGTATTLGVFEGTTRVGPTTATLRLLVCRVSHAGDFVLVGVTYPAALATDERPRAKTLFAGVEHETDG
jgi:predicted N-acetyltransferase YhbS